MPVTPITSFPQDEGTITTELNNVETQISLYLSNPAKFTASTGGTVGVDIPRYIQALQERREQLRQQLMSLPYWIDQDMDANGPMIKTS